MTALASRLGRTLGEYARQARDSLDGTAWDDASVQLLATALFGAWLLHGSGEFDLARAARILGPREVLLYDRLMRAAVSDAPVAVRELVDRVITLLAGSNLDAHAADLDLLPFYEPFLHAYAPTARRRRGVYFTPRELAAYAVRRVDEVIERDLGIAHGLAADARASLHVLDPASGVGAFLSAVIERVHARHMDQQASQAAWSSYVREVLLGRLSGFEVMPVAHALLCLQLRLVLARTGYALSADDVLDVHCVDALRLASGRLEAPRARAALDRATVIVGNPPYARGGIAPDAYKEAVREEKNLQPLADDYLRFLRLTEEVLGAAPWGAAALVLNSTMLHGHLHRGVRASLTQTFSSIDVLDLGGSTKRWARNDGQSRDESVFGIAQGVALLVMHRGGTHGGARYAELKGRRSAKLRALTQPEKVPSQALPRDTADAPLSPRVPVPAEWRTWLSLDDLFGSYSIAAKPGDDAALVAFDAETLVPRLQRLRERLRADPKQARTEAERRLLRYDGDLHAARVAPYAYRPFDTRFTYDDPDLWTRPVRRLRERVDGQRLLLASRFAHDAPFAHVFATRLLPDVIFLSNKSGVNCFAFPEQDLQLGVVRARLGFEPERAQAFAYVYAWLHVPALRARYAGALEQGFPHVAWPRSRAVFEAMASHGERLLAVHLGEVELDPWPLSSLPPAADVVRARAVEGIPAEAWAWRVGGHRVCHKWLLDRVRAGREFGADDVARYGRVVQGALVTRRVMDELEAVVEQAGGFAAFT
jgi:Type ISP C-terminal specificity domain/N-6 DNA Methylase